MTPRHEPHHQKFYLRCAEETPNQCIGFVKGTKTWQHAMHALCNDAQLQAFPRRHHLLTLGTTFLHSFEHQFWQDPENWDNKGTQRACPPTNTYPATPSRYLHAIGPPSLQASSFQVQPSSAPPFSSRLSNKDRLQPCFYPWRFSL